MSWNVTTGKVAAADVMAAIDALTLANAGYTGTFPEKEQNEALEAAKMAAKLLVQSEALGAPAELVVTLSGHANFAHVRPPGYSGDNIVVSVQQYVDYSKL